MTLQKRLFPSKKLLVIIGCSSLVAGITILFLSIVSALSGYQWEGLSGIPSWFSNVTAIAVDINIHFVFYAIAIAAMVLGIGTVLIGHYCNDKSKKEKILLLAIAFTAVTITVVYFADKCYINNPSNNASAYFDVWKVILGH